MAAAKSTIFLYISQLLRVWVPNYTLSQILSHSDSVLEDRFPFLADRPGIECYKLWWWGLLFGVAAMDIQVTTARKSFRLACIEPFLHKQHISVLDSVAGVILPMFCALHF